MHRKTLSLHNPCNSFTSSSDLSRRIGIRRRLIQRQRAGQSSEMNNSNLNSNRNRNNTNSIQINQSARTIQNHENNSLISNLSINNSNISSPSKKNRTFIKIGKSKLSNEIMTKNNNNILNKIEEEEKQKEENITSELKDTVKCYICFNIITKPKMCPHCHRIACEKCLYNWFMIEQKKSCGFCRENVNFYEWYQCLLCQLLSTLLRKFLRRIKMGKSNFQKNFKNFARITLKKNYFIIVWIVIGDIAKLALYFLEKKKIDI